MKKQLLSVFAALTVTSSVFAQISFTASPSWTISQSAAFPTPSLGVKFIDAVDQNVMWVISGDVVGAQAQNLQTIPTGQYARTTDGGNTFTSGVIPNVGLNNTYEIGNMVALDANTAWISCYNQVTGGNGAIFKTSNGGANWVNMTAAGMYTSSTSFLNIVTFLTPSVGLTLGDQMNNEFEIWRTLDGGNTWTLVPGANIPNPLSSGEYGIVDLYTKQGNSNIWFGTNQGRVFRSTDAGLTWSAHTVAATNATLIEMAFSTALNGVVYVYDGTYKVYNTTDGGVNWSQVTPLPANIGIGDIVAVPGTNYYVSVGYNPNLSNNTTISYSSDNGATWTDWGAAGFDYWILDFVDNSTGWIGAMYDATFLQGGGPTNIWKFNSSLTPNITPPSSAFYLPPNMCLNNGTTTAVNNSTGTAPLSYTWSASPAGVAFSSTNALNPTVTFTAVGSYTITLEVEGSGTVSTSYQIVDVSTCGAPSGSFNAPASVCNVSAFTLTANVTGTPAVGYMWTANPSNGVAFLPSAVVANPSVQIQTPGTYTLSMVASNISGSVQVEKSIIINDCKPVPIFTIEPAACRAATVFAWNETQNVAGATTNTITWLITPATNVQSSAVNTVVAYPNSRRFIFPANNNTTTYTITLRATNSSGSVSVTQTIHVSPCTGISENTLLENMSIYPNPAHEQLTVSLPNSSQTYTVKMMNVLGSVVYTEVVKNSNKVTINVADKAKGIYFLSVEANGEKVTKKIIVE